MQDAFDHKCSDADCPHVGQQTLWVSCRCHVSREAMMLAEIERLTHENEALRAALGSAGNTFEMIRLDMIHNLTEPERAAFWKAVTGRDAIRAALALKEPA